IVIRLWRRVSSVTNLQYPRNREKGRVMGKAMLRSATIVTATWLSTVLAQSAEKIEFSPVPGFLQLPEGITLGPCSAVAVDRRDQVYLFHRSESPILCFDRDGRFVRAWGDDLIKSPHGLRIDRDGNIWTTDTGHHLVLKFSPEGKLLLSLGT